MISIDETLFRWLNELAGRSEFVDSTVRFLISDYVIPLVATLAVAWMWLAGRTDRETDLFQHAVLLSLVALGICQLGVALLNILVGRPRPFEQLPEVNVLFYEPINSSFPAHPVATVVGLGIVLWVVRRPLGAMVLALGVVLGIGRMIAGLWFPTDVMGGIVIGALSVWAGTWVLKRLSKAEAFIRKKASGMGLG